MNGVASVALLGECRYAMRIKLDPIRLSAFGLTPEAVRTAVIRQSAVVPAGTVEEAGLKIDVVADTTLDSVEALRRIVLKSNGHYPIGRAHVRTPVTKAQHVCRALL